MSHPTWVRGLKPIVVAVKMSPLTSHPTWVRGLKLSMFSLLKCVVVAPYVGAWIETERTRDCCAELRSHPTWVRGLKRKQFVGLGYGLQRRTLRGCVD